MQKTTRKITKTAYKTAGRKRVMLLDDMSWIAEQMGEEETNNEFLEELMRAIRFAVCCELTERQRTCFQRYFDEGLTVHQIAQELAINESTVSRHITAARKKVQRHARYCAFGSAPGGRAGESRFLQ